MRGSGSVGRSQSVAEGQGERLPEQNSKDVARLDRGEGTEDAVEEGSSSEWEMDVSEVEEKCLEVMDSGRSQQSKKDGSGLAEDAEEKR